MSEKLTEQEVNQVLNAWDFLEFSRSYKDSYFNSYNTPDAINKQMQNINMNPVNASIQEIESALKNPKNSEQILRDYATSLENQNMYYKRLIRYLSDLPAYNLSFDCINIDNPIEYNSQEFKNDLKVLENFCDKFNFREEFSIALRQMLRQGVFFSVLRDDGDRYVLQELPSNFCKITGKFNYGLLFDFDFNWFISNYGVDINMYPKVFKKMYREVFENISKKYNPAKNIDYRNTSFAYWHQCSPKDGFWAWKISPEITTLIPYFAPLFSDIVLQPIIRGLQEDKYFIEASKLLVGIIGFNKDNKSGNVANQINMTPDMLGKFLGVARQGLNKQIGLVALPVDDIKPVEFTASNSNSFSDYMTNISKQSTSSSDVLLTNNKLSVHQSKLASAVDNNFIRSTYSMFENFVEYFVNLNTNKYKFKIKFNDFNTPDDFAQRKELLETYASKGATNWELMARINDKNIFEYKRQIEMENALFNDVNNLFIPLTNIYTQTNDNLNGGRPTDDNSENENTIASKERASNELI